MSLLLADPDHRLPPHTGKLLVLSLAQFIIALDYSIVYLALPDMTRQLSLSAPLAQWIVSAYGLLFAGCLLIGGRLGDRLGAARVFGVAMLAFCAASLAGGIAPTAGGLLAARAVQGISAALLQPAIIALIGLHFSQGRARSRALAIWGATGAGGLVAGIVLGGILTLLSWRLVFLINVPACLACYLLAKRSQFHQPALPNPAPLSLLASLMGTLAMLSLVVSLTLLADKGLQHPQTQISNRISALLLLIFFLNEKYHRRPLVPHALRTLRALRVGCWAGVFYMASVGSSFFVLTLMFQAQQGLDAWHAAMRFLPLALLIIPGNMLADRLIAHLAAEQVLLAGFLLAAVGLWGIACNILLDDWWYGTLPAMMVTGLGHGMIYTAHFVVGTRDIPSELQGAGGGLMVTAHYTSGAVALALLVIVLGHSAGSEGYRQAFGWLTLFSLAGAAVALYATPSRTQ